MAITLDKFLSQLADSGLMSKADVQALVDTLPAQRKPQDGEQLARELVRQKKLTAYQAQTIYKGQGKGLVLGNYVILDKLGQGGMGMVLKAQHKRMDRLVALKVLAPNVTKSPEVLRRFQREVKAAAKLTHHNIVIAFDADEAGSTHFLVMEYVEGTDLSALVKNSGVLPVDKALNCILQTARGLEYAHNHGVVHRDIKPANLLLDREGTVKILDMGLARLDSAGAQQDELTGTGQIMGTVDYMAPEQAMDTKHADARADIYSLGITLWYLLTNRAVYDADTMVKKLMAHQSKPIPSLCDACPEVSKELEAVFIRMVAKKPEDRYQSMGEVIAALEACRAPAASAPGISAARSEDSRLDAFLHGLPGSGQSLAVSTKASVAAKPPTQPDVTVNISAPAQDTDPKSQMISKPSMTPPAPTHRGAAKGPVWRSPVAIAGGAALVCVLVVLGVWVIIRDKDGNEVARVKVPEGGSATVLDNNASTTPGGKQRIQPIGPQPAIAKAPFDAKTARSHQDAWAKHLGIKVETPNSVGQTMILIPPGEFQMGSTDEQVEAALQVANEIKADANTISRIEKAERPQHKAVITKPFLMSSTEVTIGQFKKFSASGYVTEAEKAAQGANAQTYLSAGSDDLPAAYITWNDAVAYCQWLSTQEKATYRLPTEAEWEYACRAGPTTQYSFGDDRALLDQYGWYSKNAGGKSVGTLLPNPFGLFDMHGNLQEWCGDWFDEKWYEQSSPNDPNGPSAGSSRVLRGGSWNINASNCRSAYRTYNSPSYRAHFYGFRCVSEW